MKADIFTQLKNDTQELKETGLYKAERKIISPQQMNIEVEGGQHVLNFCANNYLGLSDNKDLIATGQKALDEHGYGMSSVRFICGTQDIHKNWSLASAPFSVWKTPYSTLLALMLTQACLKLCSALKMQSSAMR